MTSTNERLITNAEQAIEDLKVLEDADLDRMEKMPTWNVIDSLRFLQRLCNKKNVTVHDITPKLIIDELSKPKVYL